MIPQHLQLLTYLRAHIPVVGIDARKPRLERIHLIERKLRAANLFDAPHDVDQPAARNKPLLAQKQSLAPRFKHRLLRNQDAVAHKRDFA